MNNDIYKKIPEGFWMCEGNKLKSQMCEILEEFKMFEANYLKPYNMYSIK